jgi:hypothetical protein
MEQILYMLCLLHSLLHLVSELFSSYFLTLCATVAALPVVQPHCTVCSAKKLDKKTCSSESKGVPAS